MSLTHASRATAGLALLLLLPGWSGCARDVNGANPITPFPNQVRISFRTREPFAENRWYYMVFNFTQTSPVIEVSPVDQVSDEDRGRNWQLYVAYRPPSGSDPERLVTLQRPALPTIIPTALGPSDAAVADFGGDSQPDIAVAAERGGVVQLIRATASTNLLDPTFYDPPLDVYTGTAPKFLFAGDFNAADGADLLLVDAGAGATPASVRLLARSGDSQFTPAAPVNLVGRPVDAQLVNLDAQAAPDLVVATSGPGADQHQLEVLLNDGGGVFTPGTTFSLPATVRGIGAGDLDGDGDTDLAAGTATAGGAEAVRVLLGNGAGGLAAGPTRSVAGELAGLSVGDVNGTLDDIVASYTNATGGGSVAAFLRNQASPELSDTPEVGALSAGAGYVLISELGNDQRTDVVVADPAGDRITILRGEREVNTTDNTQRFIWSVEPVTYPSGSGPSRLLIARPGTGSSGLNADANLDLVALNSADALDGDSVALYFGLGDYNFTNADIYWTDDPPQELLVQQWYLNHAIGPNSFELTLDPGLFYDLARLAPERFFVQFFTATTGIDLISNPDQLGEVRDFLREPIEVPMDVGFTSDEQQRPLAGSNTPPNGAEDIVYWDLEVL